MDEGTPREGASGGKAEEAGAGTGDYELDLPLNTGGGAAADDAAAVTPPDEPPRPRHDPDPYSTPPYGHPGPWAPAPPVQHPATTHAHQQTQAPTPPPAQPAPEPAEPPAAAPEGITPDPATAPPTPPPPSAPAAPDHAPLPPSAPSAPGQVPFPSSGAAAPGQVPLPPSAPAAPGQVPFPSSLAAPPDLTPLPPSAPDQAPLPPSAPAVSDHVPLSAPEAFVAVPDPTPPTPSDNPWHRYDPWAPVPVGVLQQSGGGVLSAGERRRQGRQRIVGGALALALASGVLGGVVGAQLERTGGFGGVTLPQASAEPTGRAADSVAGIAARALPSVVTLHVSGSEESGTGTGFVLDTSGHILTNNHVVEPAGGDGEITVVFNGGQTAKADVVGRDSGYDLAVVKVKGVSGLRPLPLGNSDGVQVGDPVVAIGAPFDLEGTVTSGIISAKERPITAGGDSGDASDVSYVDALQTDAPINPGNSGGPLLDSRGRVIGINSAIRSAADGSDSGTGEAGSIGLGFAIPVNQGRRVAEELINTGHATHPVIGVTLDLDYAGDGARVSAKGGDAGAPVTPGGPGALAGIKAGDVITEVDGARVHSGTELIVKTRAHRPGDRLELTVERDGRERTLSLVLGSAEGD
ncbi:S1C family serine protease [Streptomyces sp. YKOK-I1]